MTTTSILTCAPLPDARVTAGFAVAFMGLQLWPAQGSVIVHCPAECNGMFEGNLYGSNPYWMHSSICPAAIHAGVISRDGGKVRQPRKCHIVRYFLTTCVFQVLMEWAGEVSSFPRSISNGVMSWQSGTR